jgi:3-dehydroquinate synthase
MKTIEAKNYQINIGKYVFTALNEFLHQNIYSKVFIIVDENTLQNCLPELIIKVPKLEKAEIIETESGEENKTIEICVQIWRVLTELKADRKSLVVNLGGGVICDMGGFAASAFKRGIDYINIPTTLLAQVDASIGGKTGIDLDNFKNQVGCFYDPKGVFIYPPFLNTLSKRQILSGYAEIVKHSLISDPVYWLEVKKFKPANPDWDSLISKSIEIKNNIVLKDPNEKGLRKVLNFGHTVGHAIETFFLEMGSPILHGEAVAAGIFCESYISYKINGLSHVQLDEISNYLLKMFKPLDPHYLDVERLLEIMTQDKKNESGQLLFTLLSEPGKGTINKKVLPDIVRQSLEFYKMRASLIKFKN